MSIILFRLVPEYLNHSASNSLIFLSLAASMQACEENHFRFKLLFQNSDFFEGKANILGKILKRKNIKPYFPIWNGLRF